jgi:hypothetical protein
LLHVWRDPVCQTFFDEPVISINFQTGNIMPIHIASELVQADSPQYSSPVVKPGPGPVDVEKMNEPFFVNATAPELTDEFGNFQDANVFY